MIYGNPTNFCVHIKDDTILDYCVKLNGNKTKFTNILAYFKRFVQENNYLSYEIKKLQEGGNAVPFEGI